MLSILCRSPVIGDRLGNRQAIQLRCYPGKFDFQKEVERNNRQLLALLSPFLGTDTENDA